MAVAVNGRPVALRPRADVHTDVSEIEFERRVIIASDQPFEGGGCGGRHQVVSLADEVQHRQPQRPQIDFAAGNFKPVLDQAILLIEPKHKLAERRACLIRAVENPLFHAHEILDSAPIRASREQIHILLVHQAERHQR